MAYGNGVCFAAAGGGLWERRQLTVLDVMACGDEAVAASGWASSGCAMSSSTRPGGTDGVGVVHLDQNGSVDRYLAYDTDVAGEPSAPNVLSEADVAFSMGTARGPKTQRART